MDYFIWLIIFAIIMSIFNVDILELKGWRSYLLGIIWGILFGIIWKLIYH